MRHVTPYGGRFVDAPLFGLAKGRSLNAGIVVEICGNIRGRGMWVDDSGAFGPRDRDGRRVCCEGGSLQ